MQENQIKREDIISDSEINDIQNKITAQMIKKVSIDFGKWLIYHDLYRLCWHNEESIENLFEDFIKDYNG